MGSVSNKKLLVVSMISLLGANLCRPSFSQTRHGESTAEAIGPRQWECPILGPQEIMNSFEKGFWWSGDAARMAGTLLGPAGSALAELTPKNESPFSQCVGKSLERDYSGDYTKVDHLTPVKRVNGVPESFETWRDRSHKERSEALVKAGKLKRPEDLFLKGDERDYIRAISRSSFSNTGDFFRELNEELPAMSVLDAFDDSVEAGDMNSCSQVYSDAGLNRTFLSTEDPLHPQRQKNWPNLRPYEVVTTRWAGGPRAGEPISQEQIMRLAIAKNEAERFRLSEGAKVNTQAIFAITSLLGTKITKPPTCARLEMLPDARKYCQKMESDCAKPNPGNNAEDRFNDALDDQLDAYRQYVQIQKELILPNGDKKGAEISKELLMASGRLDMEFINTLSYSEKADPSKSRDEISEKFRQHLTKKVQALVDRNEDIKNAVDMQYQGIGQRSENIRGTNEKKMKLFTKEEIDKYRETISSMPPLPDQPLPLRRTSTFNIWSGNGVLRVEEPENVTDSTIRKRMEMNDQLKTADCIAPISTNRDYWNGLFDSIAKEVAITAGLAVLTAATAGAAGPIAASRLASASRIASAIKNGQQIPALGSRAARIGKMLTGKGGTVIALTGLANIRDISDSSLGIMESCSEKAMVNLPSPAAMAKAQAGSGGNSCPIETNVPPAVRSYFACTLASSLGSLSALPLVGPLAREIKIGRFTDEVADSLRRSGNYKPGMEEIIKAAAHSAPKKPAEAIRVLKEAGIPEPQIAKLFDAGFFGRKPIDRFKRAGYTDEEATELAKLFKGAGDNALDLANALPAIEALEKMGKAKRGLKRQVDALAKAGKQNTDEFKTLSKQLDNYNKYSQQAAGITKEIENYLGPGLFSSKRVADLMDGLIKQGPDSLNNYKAVLAEAKRLKEPGMSHKQAFRKALDSFEGADSKAKDLLADCGIPI